MESRLQDRFQVTPGDIISESAGDFVGICTRLPMFGRCHDITCNGRKVSGWLGVAGQTNQLRISRLMRVNAFGLAAG